VTESALVAVPLCSPDRLAALVSPHQAATSMPKQAPLLGRAL